MESWNRPARNVLEYIEHSAEVFPSNLAFRDDKTQVTYAELLRQVKKLGYRIAEKVSGMPRPIVVFMEKSVECLVSFFGIAASGNFYVCMDTQMAPERIRKILDSLQPAAILGRAIQNEEIFSDYAVLDYDELLAAETEEERQKECLQKIRKNMIDADPLYILYTSGSTGIPKGSVISHRSVIDYAEWVSRTFQFDETTVFGSQTPFYFSMSVLDIFTAIRNGAALQIIPKKLFSFPVKLLEYMRETRVNAIYWVPSALSIVADWRALDYVELPNLRTVLFAGEVMPTRQLNVWRSHLPKARYANLFGPTEITDIGLYYILDREFSDEEPIPIGIPCENIDAFAVTEEGKLIGEDETGELYFRGSFVGRGYYNSPEKTREVFVQNPLHESYPDPVYCTGDLVKLNERGEYLYQGRKDFQIKHMGYRIELGEIEHAAGSFQKLDRAACIYRPEKEQIVLIYQGTAEKQEILAYLKDLIPVYMMPEEMVSVTAMPLNANGKIDRKLLQEQYGEKERKG